MSRLFPVYVENHIDLEGNPSGGYAAQPHPSDTPWLYIRWQNGPLPTPELQNGAFVEDLIKIAISRINYYNSTKFECDENHAAVECLTEALVHLQKRTARRTHQGVEGTYEGN